jgi:hypothetical protein
VSATNALVLDASNGNAQFIAQQLGPSCGNIDFLGNSTVVTATTTFQMTGGAVSVGATNALSMKGSVCVDNIFHLSLSLSLSRF